MDDTLNAPVQETVEPQQTAEEEPETVPREDFNRVWARAKTAEEETKRLREGVANTQAGSEFDVEEIVHLRSDGYSREEVEFAKNYARGVKRTLPEVLEDPFVKAGLDTMRAQRQSESATPVPSSRMFAESPVVQNYKNAKTEDERRAAFDKMTKR